MRRRPASAIAVALVLTIIGSGAAVRIASRSNLQQRETVVSPGPTARQPVPRYRFVLPTFRPGRTASANVQFRPHFVRKHADGATIVAGNTPGNWGIVDARLYRPRLTGLVENFAITVERLPGQPCSLGDLKRAVDPNGDPYANTYARSAARTRALIRCADGYTTTVLGPDGQDARLFSLLSNTKLSGRNISFPDSAGGQLFQPPSMVEGGLQEVILDANTDGKRYQITTRSIDANDDAPSDVGRWRPISRGLWVGDHQVVIDLPNRLQAIVGSETLSESELVNVAKALKETDHATWRRTIDTTRPIRSIITGGTDGVWWRLGVDPQGQVDLAVDGDVIGTGFPLNGSALDNNSAALGGVAVRWIGTTPLVFVPSNNSVRSIVVYHGASTLPVATLSTHRNPINQQAASWSVFEATPRDQLCFYATNGVRPLEQLPLVQPGTCPNRKGQLGKVDRLVEAPPPGP